MDINAFAINPQFIVYDTVNSARTTVSCFELKLTLHYKEDVSQHLEFKRLVHYCCLHIYI